jgi:IS5 family transposase
MLQRWSAASYDACSGSEMIAHVRRVFGVAIRKACRAIPASRATYHCRSRRPEQRPRHRGRGHMEPQGHLGRCYLKGRDSDAANTILTDVGYNLRLVLAWLRELLRLLLIVLLKAFAVQSTLRSAVNGRLTTATNVLKHVPDVAFSSFVLGLLTLPFGASNLGSGC